MKTKDLNLAYKLRHALDESANNLPEKTSERLSSARNMALSRKKQGLEKTTVVPRAAVAGHAGMRSSFGFDNWSAWLNRMGVIIPLAALVFGLMGLYQYEQREQIIETATIDAEVLTDDLPLSAYLDHGFDAFLSNADED